jgi:hypothetical protein
VNPNGYGRALYEGKAAGFKMSSLVVHGLPSCYIHLYLTCSLWLLSAGVSGALKV